MENLRNILLHDTKHSTSYAPSPGRGSIYPNRGSKEQAHGEFIQRQFNAAFAAAKTQKQVAAIKYKESTYLQVKGVAGYDLNLKSLENMPSGIRLLNFQETKDVESGKIIPEATIFVPRGKESFFLNRVQDFLNPEKNNKKTGSRKNKDLINSIGNISLAILSSLWTSGLSKLPEKSPVACEVWLRYDAQKKVEKTNKNIQAAIDDFTGACEVLDIPVDPKRIIFPERIVKLVKANKAQLAELIKVSGVIAEIRRAPINVDDFSSFTRSEQRDWAMDLLGRTDFDHGNVAVCVLDTGISQSHPLIEPAVDSDSSVQAVDESWSLVDRLGHGTEMAGVVLYDDLAEAIASANHIYIGHELESVKILPDNGVNDSQLYGNITQQAISSMEIDHSVRNRVICMAITDSDFDLKDGSPSSWSAAIDQITSGAGEEDNIKRLFIVSAGNVHPTELKEVSYPNANLAHPVEDPAQAWNALSVGAYNDKINVSNPVLNGFSPVADVNELSPYSSTSNTWQKKWPIKPEILLRGGNMVTNGSDADADSELEVLTTNANFTQNMFSTISGTSSATAQASNMAARLYEAYPDLWPETVRALMVHSAEWTDAMKKQFCGDEKKTVGRKNLLHACGYGVASLERAIECKKNSVNLIIQDSLQPFDGAHMKDMNFHQIPWPSEILEDLGAANAKLRVTLSYFVEPGPGRNGWGNRYRYSSAGLRFDLIKPNETKKEFEKRVNFQMRDENDGASGGGRDDWYLGPKNRNVGSIHSDFICTSAAELANSDYIAIYPVVGWWRERQNLHRSGDVLRYSLIVSIETPESHADLYDAISTKIAQTIKY